jgi:hypothetical protein
LSLTGRTSRPAALLSTNPANQANPPATQEQDEQPKAADFFDTIDPKPT